MGKSTSLPQKWSRRFARSEFVFAKFSQTIYGKDARRVSPIVGYVFNVPVMNTLKTCSTSVKECALRHALRNWLWVAFRTKSAAF